MIDVVIENLFLAACDLYMTQHGPIQFSMSVIATGGYGRGELNPHSDIDILFLYPDGQMTDTLKNFQELMAEEILYPLWDLGLKVGHASRNTLEVLKEINSEIQSKNAILESRLICGSPSLFQKMYDAFLHNILNDRSSKYIAQRLKDESERHAKYGNTVYLQEPDIKNGVGGLRDYQNILWISKIQFGMHTYKELEKKKFIRPDERKTIEAAYDFLLRARTELHYQNKRPTDKIDLEQQLEIATQMHYTEENSFDRLTAFMQDYYSAARTIFRICSLLQERLSLIETKKRKRFTFLDSLKAHRKQNAQEIDGFQLHDGTFYASRHDLFTKDPNRLIRIFRLKQQFRASLDIELKHRITHSIPLIDHKVINSPDAAKSFKAILSKPGEVFNILNEMHALGVLGRYIPEFGRLTCLIQHEYYHRYTADEHVLRTIKHLDSVFQKKDPMDHAYEFALRKNELPELLYLILLLHDIGKSDGIQGHAESGVTISRPILERFQVSHDQQEKILFIIQNHLEMARFWQRFDIDDIQTAISFSSIIKNCELLRYLYVHTYCDAKGTAPALWNSFKDAMHSTLYQRTLKYIESQSHNESLSEESKSMLKQDVLKSTQNTIPEEEIDAHFSLLPDRYFVNTEATEAILHLNMINQLLEQIQSAESIGSLSPVIDWRNDINLGMSVINVVTWDRSGLFYKLAGALTLSGLAITSTRAISRKDHISIDTFYVVDFEGKMATQSNAKERLKEKIEATLVHGDDQSEDIDRLEKTTSKKANKETLLPSPFPPSVEVYHELSLQKTIIEVKAKDQPGLLFRLAKTISQLGFDIHFARIATERSIAMDTFYIENNQAKEENRTTDLLALKEELKAIIQSS